MKNIYTFRYRTFLNPVSTNQTSYIHAHVESTYSGTDRWGDHQIVIADCRRMITLEFSIGTKRHQRVSLAKLDVLINVLTGFRQALLKEIEQIDRWNKPRSAEKRG
jgi:hypothetical protein